MQKNLKKEIARDLMAFGSIPFYFIVIVRSTIGQYLIFVYQLLIAALVLYLISIFFKESNAHIARSFIIVFFTSIFYKDMLFTVFAFLLWIIIVYAAYFIKIDKNEIIKGAVYGIIAVLVSYYLSPIILNLA